MADHVDTNSHRINSNAAIFQEVCFWKTQKGQIKRDRTLFSPRPTYLLTDWKLVKSESVSSFTPTESSTADEKTEPPHSSYMKAQGGHIKHTPERTAQIFLRCITGT